jgi:hypothetical protein
MAKAAFGPDASTVTLDNVARNSQSQARARLAPRSIYLVESLKDAGQVFGRDAGAGISHCNCYVIAAIDPLFGVTAIPDEGGKTNLRPTFTSVPR